ncbi:BatD [hydrothermal vent metagenome]|uniref:BatD n=1 Tax=hydrothermal vent metagenome TaxID=652676 RepID=A0A1W1BM19_9ZZZZ
MKKNLASIVLLLVVLLLDLSASTYKWSSKVDKKTAYINEAILLTYVCEFSDASELYTIDFNPVQDNVDFSIKLLKESQGLKNFKRVNSYEFIAYVKREGRISFDFDIVMKKTTQESINSTTAGHYDDSKSESFILTQMKQLPLSVNIKDTPFKLVGEFTLTVKQDKPTLKPYDPYNLEIQIQGTGNFSSVSPIDFSIDGVKVFTQSPVLRTDLTENGEKGVWSQKFAFVSEKSFVIPEVGIEYFDVNIGRLKKLTLNTINVSVENDVYNQEDILDIKEEKDYLYKPEYLYYLLIFLLGFLVAKIKLNIFKPQRTEQELFLKSIKETTSLEKLCFLLVSKDTKKYEELISKIESKELRSLKKAKDISLRFTMIYHK